MILQQPGLLAHSRSSTTTSCTGGPVLIGSATALGNWLRKPHARKILDRVTGLVIAGFALRLSLGD
ncbi:hypothetical protein GCM10010441_26780 [Kitasatospora paracochleata]|uniref:Threonine/homoserine/homoserine lactone efflux protein n=1 Tax=Kitasatospora paracochleata TaxID=58354 RepID=A0ABT1IW66_9ACTN|nr:hypothetical protein [Kitasatospora paracochleata]MCP2309398.1 threonine/homoserine/homoserine lactone efflux protein [Kitasatospora paracochleata]